MNSSTSPFKKKVIEIVNRIPYGHVASYGQVALYCGVPRAAREVGWTLNTMENTIEVPWWRVINTKGQITIKGSEFTPDFQKKLLESEGIVVNPDFTLEMEKYRWRPAPSDLPTFELSKEYLESLLEKYRKFYKES